MALREALKERASLNDFELHSSPIHELIQYSFERSESMRKRMEEAWTSGGALSAILSGVDEMTDGKGVIGWIVRRLYKGSLKKKPNAMRGAEIDERIIGDMEKYLRLRVGLAPLIGSSMGIPMSLKVEKERAASLLPIPGVGLRTRIGFTIHTWSLMTR